MKYFVMNVNFSLIVPLLALIVYTGYMARKFRKRSQYLDTRQQIDKDLYTVFRRSTQWVYDHSVFPLVSLFSMIAFFCTILYLQSNSSPTSIKIKSEDTFAFVEKTNFMPNLFFVFLTFYMLAYEVFASYDQFLHSRLSK